MERSAQVWQRGSCHLISKTHGAFDALCKLCTTNRISPPRSGHLLFPDYWWESEGPQFQSQSRTHILMFPKREHLRSQETTQDVCGNWKCERVVVLDKQKHKKSFPSNFPTNQLQKQINDGGWGEPTTRLRYSRDQISLTSLHYWQEGAMAVMPWCSGSDIRFLSGKSRNGRLKPFIQYSKVEWQDQEDTSVS